MSLKVLNAVMKHIQRHHGQQSTVVAGLTGKGVQEQCTSECCRVCLCDYIGWWGEEEAGQIRMHV